MALGELIVWFTGLSLPGSIVGMLLLTAFLQMGWIKLEWVKGISDFLLSNLGFFFVPVWRLCSISTLLPKSFGRLSLPPW